MDFKRKIRPDEEGYEEGRETRGKELHTFFFSSEHSIKKQADYRLTPETEGLCGTRINPLIKVLNHSISFGCSLY